MILREELNDFSYSYEKDVQMTLIHKVDELFGLQDL